MFITFEGPEGSGKSTQIPLLADFLTQQGYHVYRTREPGGTPIGDEIRRVVHDVRFEEMHPLTEILLYSASRAQHVAQVIKPKLAQGHIILCDRFADSTYAYQGYGHGLSLDTLRRITEFATQGLTPDVTFYLDISPEVGLQRKQRASAAGQGEWNRMDQLTLAFHQRVRQGYQALIHADPARWHSVDASADVSAVQAHLQTVVLPKFA